MVSNGATGVPRPGFVSSFDELYAKTRAGTRVSPPPLDNVAALAHEGGDIQIIVLEVGDHGVAHAVA